MQFQWRTLLALLPSMAFAVTGCGGGKVSATSTPVSSQNGSTVTAVSVSCTPTPIKVNGTSQCAATVQGTGSYSSAVTWSASSGTVSTAGLFTASATAGAATITAISVQDGSKSGTASVTSQYATPASRHVVVVMEENQSYLTVVGSSAWPNLNNLIANGALPTNYYADTHPSIGNYFMLTTGQVLTNDDSSVTVWNVDNIARHMIAANVSFKVYAEGITQGYLGGDTGLYVIHHNPFAMLSDVAGTPSVANAVLCPFTQFATDLANNALPEFSFIVPNLDDDAHNGTPQQADSWLLSNVVMPLSNNSAFQKAGDGVLMVVFDEAAQIDTAHGGGQVSQVFWGPIVKVGYKQTTSNLYQHESLLRTVMELLQLSGPPGAAGTAPSMAEFFVQ